MNKHRVVASTAVERLAKTVEPLFLEKPQLPAPAPAA